MKLKDKFNLKIFFKQYYLYQFDKFNNVGVDNYSKDSQENNVTKGKCEQNTFIEKLMFYSDLRRKKKTSKRRLVPGRKIGLSIQAKIFGHLVTVC